MPKVHVKDGNWLIDGQPVDAGETVDFPDATVERLLSGPHAASFARESAPKRATPQPQPQPTDSPTLPDNGQQEAQ